jgi:hypothetical protein
VLLFCVANFLSSTVRILNFFTVYVRLLLCVCVCVCVCAWARARLCVIVFVFILCRSHNWPLRC